MSTIVADVGGTNARFGLVCKDAVSLSNISNLRCADFDDFYSAYDEYSLELKKNLIEANTLCVAIAGPVGSDQIKLSNNSWCFNKYVLFEKLKLENLMVINDFTAQALAQYDPGNQRRVKILDGVSNDEAPLLAAGPGTGLGVSALFFLEGGPLPVEGEGGNVRFSPQNSLERDLDSFVRESENYVSVEHFVSGPGLERIYAFFERANDVKLCLSAEGIISGALGGDFLCQKTINVMLGIFGAALADYVLTIGCWRGVVICGGIIPRISTLITKSPFANRFRIWGAFSSILKNVPVWLSTDPYAGLRGANVALTNPYLSHKILSR